MRVERKGSGEGGKMTAEGGPFMKEVEADYFFRLSAKIHKRGLDYPNRVHSFPDAYLLSDYLLNISLKLGLCISNLIFYFLLDFFI